MKTDVELRSSITDASEFVDLKMWKDIVAELEGWIEAIRHGLETETDKEEILRLQRRVEACRYFLVLPSVILEDLKLTKEVEEEEDER